MSARILIIEDNPANLELMTYLLKAFGHTTLAAHDGEEGVEVACRELPELIICDVQLPKADGYEVVSQLKKHPALCSTPVVAVTALAMVGDRNKALAAGFDGYISKPIAPEIFVQQVESFLHIQPSPLALPKLQEAAPVEQLPLPKRAVILVVDNSSINISLARSILEPSGYEVISADRVSDALTLVRQVLPDMIMSDVHMPDATGFDLLRAVKADPELKSIPYIFISSTNWDEKERTRALALGAEKFILRPIEPQLLLAEIEECLRKRTKNGKDTGS